MIRHRAAVAQLAVADEGIEVAVAPSLADARAHLRDRMPELILTDVSLPDGNGYAFCREIKREKTTRDVPVLLLASAQDPLDDKLRPRSARMVRCRTISSRSARSSIV
jgi:DNA-binding response OmpR family regulator